MLRNSVSGVKVIAARFVESLERWVLTASTIKKCYTNGVERPIQDADRIDALSVSKQGTTRQRIRIIYKDTPWRMAHWLRVWNPYPLLRIRYWGFPVARSRTNGLVNEQ